MQPKPNVKQSDSPIPVPGNVSLVSKTAEEASNGAPHPDTVNQEMLKDCLGSRTASPGISPVENSDALHQRFLKVGLVSVAAGRRIRKRPVGQFSQPMAGDQPIAAGAGPNPHRPLRPTCCPTFELGVCAADHFGAKRKANRWL